jgi:hypothetical protein
MISRVESLTASVRDKYLLGVQESRIVTCIFVDVILVEELVFR